MPARSKAQQEAMAIELAHRMAGNEASRFPTMTIKQLHDFAHTPTEGLPERVKPKPAKRGKRA